MVSLLPLAAGAEHDGSGHRGDPYGTKSSLHWEEALALRVEGYMGFSKIDADPGDDDDSFQGGGMATASWSQDAFYGQFDLFGDSQDYDDRVSMVGFGLHAGVRDPSRGQGGVVLAYNGEDVDTFRLGAEGELYVEQLTLGASLGYMKADPDDFGIDEDLFFFDAGIDFYPDDDVRLEFGGGVVDNDDIDPVGFLKAGIEIFLAAEVPVAFFGRWEASFYDDNVEVEQHSLVAGVKFYWGGGETSLVGYDRNRFQNSCIGFQFIARTC